MATVHGEQKGAAMGGNTDAPQAWGGGLRKDWPPETAAIITCPSCGYRHGCRYMCDERLRVIEAAERTA